MQQQVAGGNIWCQTQKSSYVLSDLPNPTTYVTSENICVEEITRIKSEHFQGVQEISPRLRHNSTLLRAATSDSGDFDHSGSRSRRLPPRCTVTGLPASREDIEMAFHDIRARTLDGQVVSMEKYKGKVVLVENTASLWGTTVRDFTQMNELCEKVVFKDESANALSCIILYCILMSFQVNQQ